MPRIDELDVAFRGLKVMLEKDGKEDPRAPSRRSCVIRIIAIERAVGCSKERWMVTSAVVCRMEAKPQRETPSRNMPRRKACNKALILVGNAVPGISSIAKT